MPVLPRLCALGPATRRRAKHAAKHGRQPPIHHWPPARHARTADLRAASPTTAGGVQARWASAPVPAGHAGRPLPDRRGYAPGALGRNNPRHGAAASSRAMFATRDQPADSLAARPAPWWLPPRHRDHSPTAGKPAGVGTPRYLAPVAPQSAHAEGPPRSHPCRPLHKPRRRLHSPGRPVRSSAPDRFHAAVAASMPGAEPGAAVSYETEPENSLHQPTLSAPQTSVQPLGLSR